MANHRVIVYSTAACPWCYRLKDWLKEHGIMYEDVDVGADPARAQEMIDKSGQMGVPVADINGRIIVGFDEEKLRAALGMK